MDDDRPRWSFVWLLRIQRIGRNRRAPTSDDDGRTVTPRLRRWIIVAIVAGIVIAEVLFGVWLGILPR